MKKFLGLLCAVMANVHALEPIPSFYEEPGLSRNRDYVNQNSNEHIDPFTGKLQLHYVDLFIPGNGGLDIKIQRSYTSLNSSFLSAQEFQDPSPLGVGWTMHYGRVMRMSPVALCDNSNVSPDKAPVLELPDGSRHILYLEPGHSYWLTTGRWKAECVASGSGGMNVFALDGTRYEMTTIGVPVGSPLRPQFSWYTTRIVDRNDNWLAFSYINGNSKTMLTGISSSDGRSVILNYSNERLTSVQSNNATWIYRSTPSSVSNDIAFLTEVERPDGTKWKYDYYPNRGELTAGNYSLQTMTFPTGASLTYDYGFVIFNTFLPKTTVVSSKRDNEGHQWQFAYDPAQRPCVLDPTGSYCTLVPGSYDVTTIVAPDGVATQYAHIGANTVWRGLVYSIGLPIWRIDGYVNGSGEQVEEFAWDAQQISPMLNFRPPNTLTYDGAIFVPIQTERYINRNGQSYVTQYSHFDDFDNPGVISETGPDGRGSTHSRTTTKTYFTNAARWFLHIPKDETTNTIGTITRSYDSNANLTNENRYGVTTALSYFGNGEIASKTDARNFTVQYSDYYRGIPRREIYPEGIVITRAVSDAGNVTSQTDGEGHMVHYSYDSLNRITGITHPLGNAVNVVWSANQRVVMRGDYRETLNFDGFGRVVSKRYQDTAQGADILQTYVYDSYGRQVFASYPNDNRGTRTHFDALGRPWKIEHATTLTGAATAKLEKEFGGYQTLLTNENGNQFLYHYRGFGDPDRLDLMQTNTPLANADVVIERNGLGQPTKITQDGKERNYTYSPKYFLVMTNDPETGVTQFGRDEVGNMISSQVGSSGFTQYAYDGLNRLITTTYPIGTPSVSRAYYRDHKIKSIETSEARREYFYDANKNLTQEKLIIGSKSFSLQYEYNANDNLANLMYGSGRMVRYLPDALGRATQAAPYITHIEYYPSGAIKRLVYANGVSSDVQLNERLWPALIRNISGPVHISALSYGYDAVGNVLMIADPVNPEFSRSFAYDNLDRLTVVNSPGLSAEIQYDGRGNILRNIASDAPFSATPQLLNYSYEPDTDRLARITKVNLKNPSLQQVFPYSYDTYGNVISNGKTSFTYNDAKQMRCANCGQPNEIAYMYDGNNLRIRQQKGSEIIYFVYGSSGNLMWEQVSSGEVKEYIYLAGKQVAVRRAAQ